MLPIKQEPAPATLDDELLLMLARQGRRMPYPVFLAAVMFSWLATDPPDVPDQELLAWLAVVALVLAVRMVVLARLPALARLGRRRCLQAAVALSMLNGATHGAGILLFAAPTDFQFAIQSLLFVGLCAGAVATTAGYRPVFLGYMLPVIVPLVFLWCTDVRHSGNVAVGAIIALFAGVLMTLSSDSFRLFRESFEIRSQQAQLNDRLRTALDRAEAASRAKTRFLAAASHDLRQPIHTLSLFSAALALRPLDEGSRDIARHIEAALENLGAQLDALLDISKLDAGVVYSRPVVLALRPLLARLASDFGPIAQARQLQMSLDAPQDAVVLTDDVLLRRVIANLIDNAIKYTDDGDIILGMRREHGTAVVTIEDTGRGIAQDEQEKVFEEFYQLDNPERNRAKGLGLGLSIVHRLASLLGIRMEMVSRPGLGTCFFMFLPEYAGQPERSTSPAAGDPGIHARHVLVVDDELDVRQGMQTLLQELGARVTIADGLAQALAATRQDPPDVVLSDFRLRAGEDGITLIQAIRSMHPGLPAILISGDTSPERLREAYQAGIPMLHKPVTRTLLQQAIEDATMIGHTP